MQKKICAIDLKPGMRVFEQGVDLKFKLVVSCEPTYPHKFIFLTNSRLESKLINPYKKFHVLE